MRWPVPFDDAALRHRLGLDGALRHAPRGALVGEQGVDADVVVATEGSFAVRRAGRWLRGVQAPAHSGLDAWLARRPYDFERQAREDMRYAALPRELLDRAIADDAGLAVRLAREVAALACRRADDQSAQAQAYDDLFTDDHPGARLAPGPYRFGPFPATLLVMEEDPARIRRLLPAGLRLTPGLGGRYLVMVSFIEDARRVAAPAERFGYREVALFVPVISAHGPPGLFAVELYPDAAMPVLLGREIYGFPKRLGRIEPRRDGFELVVGQRGALRAQLDAPIAVDADRFGQHLFRALMGAAAPRSLARALGRLFGAADRAASGLGWPDLRVITQKRIEGVAAAAPPAVDQLVEVPLAPFGFGDYGLHRIARVTLDPGVLPLGGQLLAAARCRLGFELGDGTIRHETPAAPRRRSGILRRLRPALVPGGSTG